MCWPDAHPLVLFTRGERPAPDFSPNVMYPDGVVASAVYYWHSAGFGCCLRRLPLLPSPLLVPPLSRSVWSFVSAAGPGALDRLRRRCRATHILIGSSEIMDRARKYTFSDATF